MGAWENTLGALTKHLQQDNGVHDYYRETLTLWAVTTKETKLRGVTIMES